MDKNSEHRSVVLPKQILPQKNPSGNSVGATSGDKNPAMMVGEQKNQTGESAAKKYSISAANAHHSFCIRKRRVLACFIRHWITTYENNSTYRASV